MSFDSLNKEQQIMVVMRKVLSSVIKDVTPQPGMRSPLSEKTVQDIRMCLGLIATREKELLEEKGIENPQKPRYVDEPAQSSQVVQFASTKNVGNEQED